MTRENLEQLWCSPSYSFDLLRDPPGKKWEDVHYATDELIFVLEGELEVEIEGEKQSLHVDEEVFIPANTMHTIRNCGSCTALWLHGYRTHS